MIGTLPTFYITLRCVSILCWTTFINETNMFFVFNIQNQSHMSYIIACNVLNFVYKQSHYYRSESHRLLFTVNVSLDDNDDIFGWQHVLYVSEYENKWFVLWYYLKHSLLFCSAKKNDILFSIFIYGFC